MHIDDVGKDSQTSLLAAEGYRREAAKLEARIERLKKDAADLVSEVALVEGATSFDIGNGSTFSYRAAGQRKSTNQKKFRFNLAEAGVNTGIIERALKAATTESPTEASVSWKPKKEVEE
ncbi:MAG: hypothetical protein ACYTEQ_01305 [Planctomycetota bacterium]|jgi:hypothetical protein